MILSIYKCYRFLNYLFLPPPLRLVLALTRFPGALRPRLFSIAPSGLLSASSRFGAVPRPRSSRQRIAVGASPREGLPPTKSRALEGRQRSGNALADLLCTVPKTGGFRCAR